MVRKHADLPAAPQKATSKMNFMVSLFWSDNWVGIVADIVAFMTIPRTSMKGKIYSGKCCNHYLDLDPTAGAE